MTTATFAYVLVEWGQPLFVIREVAQSPERSGDMLGTALALRAAFAVVGLVPVGLSRGRSATAPARSGSRSA